MRTLRWRLVSALNRLQGACWSDLYDWYDDPDHYSLVGALSTKDCRQDAARCGACYCGKLRRPGGPA